MKKEHLIWIIIVAIVIVFVVLLVYSNNAYASTNLSVCAKTVTFIPGVPDV